MPKHHRFKGHFQARSETFNCQGIFPHLIARKSKFGQIMGSEKEIIRPRIPAQKKKQKKNKLPPAADPKNIKHGG